MVFTGPLTVVRVHKQKIRGLRFRALLSEDDARVLFHRETFDEVST
jgi:hypothetical protein